MVARAGGARLAASRELGELQWRSIWRLDGVVASAEELWKVVRSFGAAVEGDLVARLRGLVFLP